MLVGFPVNFLALTLIICNGAKASEVLSKSKLWTAKVASSRGGMNVTSTLIVCQRDWAVISRRHHGPEVAKCMQTFVNAALPLLIRRGGSPEFGITLSEPAFLSGVGVVTNPLVYAEIGNVTVHGLSEALVTEGLRFKYDQVTKVATATLAIPRTAMETRGNVAAFLDVAPVLGLTNVPVVAVGGNGLLKADSLFGILQISMKTNGNGELRPKSTTFAIDGNSPTFAFTSGRQDLGFSVLAGTLLSTTEVAMAVFAELKGMVNRYYGRAFHLLLRHGWKVLDVA